jgi:predicted regulator of Ras-like GTPase activity (Roadblock/LC7/MglB family)
MNVSNIVLHEPNYSKIRATLSRLIRDTQASLAMLIDRGGHSIAVEGDPSGIDLTALASLAAASLSATDGLAKLLGEPDFAVLYHQGVRRSLYITDIAKRFSLVVILTGAVPLGMVRLKASRAGSVIEDIFHAFLRKSTVGTGAATAGAAPDFSDDEIEKLVRQLKPGA